MTAVVIIAHHERTEAGALANVAAKWLGDRGHQVWMSPEDAGALSLESLGSDRPVSEADVAMSMGGDGTVLRAVQLLDGAEVPIIGVNVGLLGYLTEVEPPSLTTALERYFDGDFTLEVRMMLAAVLHRGCGRPDGAAGTSQPHSWRALNEVVIEKDEPGHTVRLQVEIDGAPFTSYAADGLIVATPTGSTAYSLSARGPVVSPTHRAVLLTPVSPHMLFDRSLVLDPEDPLSIEVIGHRSAVLSVDGRRVAHLDEGDVVSFRPAEESVTFVRFGRRRFHQILKAKFGLTDR
jgi:NAD+ kinase